MLFRVCRDERRQRWIALVEGRLYGEYLDKEEAILDAVEAATDARASGNEAEVWDQPRHCDFTDRCRRGIESCWPRVAPRARRATVPWATPARLATRRRS